MAVASALRIARDDNRDSAAEALPFEGLFILAHEFSLRSSARRISIEATAIRWLGQAAIPKTTRADLLVSDGLLTQPGSFEGLVTVQELVPANDLVIAQERYRPALHGDLDAAALAPPFKGLSGEDMVAPNQELRRFDLERVPGVQPTLEEWRTASSPWSVSDSSNGRYSTSSWKPSMIPSRSPL